MAVCACFSTGIPGPPGPTGATGPRGPAGTVPTVAAVDTPCIDMTVTGGPNYVVSAVPIIDPAAGNQLSCGPAGLLVPAGQVTIVAAQDTPCMDVTVTQAPVGTFTISAVPIIDPAAGNQLSCGPAGLLVPAGQVTIVAASDTPCIDTTVTQGPPGTFTIGSVPILDPIAGNQLTCGPAGLLVPAAAAAAITTLDTDSVNLTGNGTVGTPLQADVIIDPAVGNQLVSNPAGLFVPDCQTPVGAIIMWPCTPIPAGWAICDGTGGTPNLVDFIPMGAGGVVACGATAGNLTVTLTTNEMPNHTHIHDAHSHNITVDTNGFLTGGQTADHTHNEGLAGNHDHTVDGAGNGAVWAFRFPGSVEGLQNAGTGTRATFSNLNANGDHTHPLSGSTSNHQHDATHGHTGSASLETTTEQSEGTGNSFSILPPVRGILFIMKMTAC